MLDVDSSFGGSEESVRGGGEEPGGLIFLFALGGEERFEEAVEGDAVEGEEVAVVRRGRG